jgi:hypothetical protein
LYLLMMCVFELSFSLFHLGEVRIKINTKKQGDRNNISN